MQHNDGRVWQTTFLEVLNEEAQQQARAEGQPPGIRSDAGVYPGRQEGHWRAQEVSLWPFWAEPGGTEIQGSPLFFIAQHQLRIGIFSIWSNAI